MGKISAEEVLTRAIVAFIIIAIVNYGLFKVFGRPLVYCKFARPLSQLYLAWGTVILFITAAYTALKLFQGQQIPALGGVAVFIGIVELPRLAEQMFRLGGSCG